MSVETFMLVHERTSGRDNLPRLTVCLAGLFAATSRFAVVSNHGGEQSQTTVAPPKRSGSSWL